MISCEIVRTRVRRWPFLCNKEKFLDDRSIFLAITLDLCFLILDLLLCPISSGTEAILRISFVVSLFKLIARMWNGRVVLAPCYGRCR